jgi:hypothetical protein
MIDYANFYQHNGKKYLLYNGNGLALPDLLTRSGRTKILLKGNKSHLFDFNRNINLRTYSEPVTLSD